MTRHATGASNGVVRHPSSVDASTPVIRTPDQRLRVFISSTLQELAPEREAAARAIRHLRLAPVMFELGARPHAPRSLYRAYLEQSEVFIGIYWQRYGWVAPGEQVSGLEDEYRLAGDRPKLIYIKTPAADREAGLGRLLDLIRSDDHASYKSFSSPSQLRALIENDLAVLLSERFLSGAQQAAAPVHEQREQATRRTNVPAATSTFIGREAEVATIVELLRGSKTRLVTLTGPGGVGKTRLSLEVVRSLGRSFGGGVHFVSLASITDPDLVISAVAQQIGAPQQNASSPLERVRERLRGRRTLVVLDNFEQVVSAAPRIAELLAGSPRLTLLVTSRTLLEIRGETEFDVRPLPVPAARGEVSLDVAAVRLFLERARAIRPEIGNEPSELAAIAEICRRLDGLPLAIELAAARIRVLSPEAILRRLNNTLGLLTHGAPDLPDRQRTLRATLDWSFDLLNDTERTLFRRLSVFAGGWTLEATEAMCKLDTDIDVLDTLMVLVDRSLVQRDPDGRFRMLSVIHEYARERLATSPERGAVEAAHAKYMLEFAQAAATQLRGAGQQTWRALLAAEEDNVRAAMRWMLDSGDLESASKLQVALIAFWWIQGYTAEARRWSDELLARADSLDPASAARAQLAGGVAAAWEGDYETGIPRLERAVAQFHAIGDSLGAGVAELALAYALPSATDYARKQTLLLESAADLYQAGDLWTVNVALQSRADVALASGHVADAGELYHDGLELARQQADVRGRAQAQVGLGFVALQTNDVKHAEQLFECSMLVSLELGNPELLGHTLRGLAGVAHTRAQHHRAAVLLGAARSLVDESGAVDWPTGRQLWTQLEHEVKQRLGEAAFAAAFDEGRALSMAAAAQFAIQEKARRRQGESTTLSPSTGTRRCADAELRAGHPPAVSRQRRRRDAVRV
jgi:predicted ATPase